MFSEGALACGGCQNVLSFCSVFASFRSFGSSFGHLCCQYLGMRHEVKGFPTRLNSDFGSMDDYALALSMQCEILIYKCSACFFDIFFSNVLSHDN